MGLLTSGKLRPLWKSVYTCHLDYQILRQIIVQFAGKERSAEVEIKLVVYKINQLKYTHVSFPYQPVTPFKRFTKTLPVCFMTWVFSFLLLFWHPLWMSRSTLKPDLGAHTKTSVCFSHRLFTFPWHMQINFFSSLGTHTHTWPSFPLLPSPILTNGEPLFCLLVLQKQMSSIPYPSLPTPWGMQTVCLHAQGSSYIWSCPCGVACPFLRYRWLGGGGSLHAATACRRVHHSLQEIPASALQSEMALSPNQYCAKWHSQPISAVKSRVALSANQFTTESSGTASQ